jgi:hypothetical protein
LLDKGDQRVADLVGEGAGPCGGEGQDLEAVGERSFVAALATIFEVVMDRVIVGRDRLKSCEMCFGHRAARDIKFLANRQILEIARFPETVPAAVEAQSHNASQ